MTFSAGTLKWAKMDYYKKWKVTRLRTSNKNLDYELGVYKLEMTEEKEQAVSVNHKILMCVLAAKSQFPDHVREDIPSRDRKILMSSHSIHISPGILCAALFIQERLIQVEIKSRERLIKHSGK